MTPEAKLRILASADATLQADLGTSPFRWYDKQVQQKTAFPCVTVLRVSTLLLVTQQGLNPLDGPRYQIDVRHSDPEVCRRVANHILTFLGTISLAQGNDFASPPTTPPQAPNIPLNRRESMDYQLQPPVHVHSLDVRIFNLEDF